MAFRLLFRLPFFLLLVLISTSLWAGTAGNLTGVHRELAACNQVDDLIAGVSEIKSCLEGHRYQAGTQFALVQHGDKVCGNFYACAGRNCNQLFSGETVGIISGRSVTLYSATGHIEDGDAEVATFDISPKGELMPPGSKKPAFKKIPLSAMTSKSARLCNPMLQPPIRIKNFELDINGTRPDLTKIDPVDKPTFTPPRPYRVNLRTQHNELNVPDGVRVAGNLIPRKVWITNSTDSAWRVTTLSSKERSACAEWLASSEKSASAYVWAYQSNQQPEYISPKSGRYTRLCSGDTLRLERILPACPKFQCLKDCEC